MSKDLLARHKAYWSTCRECPKVGVHKALYRGSINPTYLFIGEAPGSSENVTGIPFTGKDGILFLKLLEAANCISYGLTYVVGCTPKDSGQQRKPNELEILNCQPRLDELIELIGATYYISLGQVAKKNLVPGLKYSLSLDSPSFLSRKGDEQSLVFKRNKHQLIRFMESVNG